MDLDCKYLPEFQKIRQIEIGPEFAHLSMEVPDVAHADYEIHWKTVTR